MRNRHPLVYLSLAFVCILTLLSCGIKGDPKPPDRTLIPAVESLQGKVFDGHVVLSWAPVLRYSDGDELQIRRVEIFVLEEELTNRLKEYREREEKQRAKTKTSFNLQTTTQYEKAEGPVRSRILDLSKLPIERFASKSRLAASVPVEQLLDMATAGYLHWIAPSALDSEDLPSKRYIYAIRIVDDRGRKSPFSNLISIYPTALPQGPQGIEAALTQEKLTLLWQFPPRIDEISREMALIGFNVYRASGQDSFPPAPVNAEPIPTGAPMNWKVNNVISHQRIDGTVSRYAYLFTTNNAQEGAGLSQTIYSPEVISSKVGTTVTVEAVISSVGGESDGRLILDASKLPGSDEPPYGSDIFREEENPLIAIKNIKITHEPQRFTFSSRVPTGALAYVLRIEPRGKAPVAASFIIESISAREEGSEENIIVNGDFDGFMPVNYSEPVAQFGQSFRYRVSAVYSLAGLTVEIGSQEEKKVDVIDTFPPDAPKGLRAQATFDSITLTWSVVKNPDLKGYMVFRRTKGEARWQRLNPNPIRQVIYRDQDVKAAVSYEYRVEAQDNAGNMSESSSIAAAQILESERRNKN